MNITFIDKNKSLVSKVKKAVKYFPIKITVKEGDIFKENGVIVSASNPQFTFGGGLDATIARNYTHECAVKQDRIEKGNERLQNVIFTITVNNELKATRELVASALKFALSEVKDTETVLISGLGTGIGGLDGDDFVWLFLQAISESYGYGWGIKFVKKNSTDFRTGLVKYRPGKWLEQLDAPKDKQDCGVGLHLGKSFIGAGNYSMPEKIFFCIYEKDTLCGEGDDKVRVSKLLPLVELPQWLGYGLNGKKIVKKIGKKINPEKYNPYQATKLPTLNDIKNTGLRAQVGAQVLDQVLDQVWDQVGDQVGAQVRAQVGAQVLDQVWDQVWAQVRAQVGAQVWDQVRAQVRANSYWAIGLVFDLGISHWFGNLLKLGVMIVFVSGKIKVFGKKGKYLGEYDEKDLMNQL